MKPTIHEFILKQFEAIEDNNNNNKHRHEFNVRFFTCLTDFPSDGIYNSVVTDEAYLDKRRGLYIDSYTVVVKNDRLFGDELRFIREEIRNIPFYFRYTYGLYGFFLLFDLIYSGYVWLKCITPLNKRGKLISIHASIRRKLNYCDQ